MAVSTGFDFKQGKLAGVQITGLQETLRDLEQMRINVADMTVIHTVVASAVRNWQVRNIKTRKRSAHGLAWAPLKESTIAARRNKRKSSIKILEDTGRMRGSIRRRHSNHSGWLVDTQVPYATFHQHGTRKMRKREFFYLTTQDETDMVDYYASEAAAKDTTYISWTNRQRLPGAVDVPGFGAGFADFGADL